MNTKNLIRESEHMNRDADLIKQRISNLLEEALAVLIEVELLPIRSIVSFLEDKEAIRAGINLEEEIRNIEIFLIKRALKVTGNNQKDAAKILNIKHTTLNAKIKRWGIGWRDHFQ